VDRVTCRACGKTVAEQAALQVDGEFYCRQCIHGDVEPVVLYPIGVVHREDDQLCRIELQPFMKRFMHRLEEEQHLTIVYLLHKTRDVKSVFNRGLDGKQVGVFASRTPRRPTPIAITEVELERIEGTTLYVRGLDAFDGSPVLDIKLGYQVLRR